MSISNIDITKPKHVLTAEEDTELLKVEKAHEAEIAKIRALQELEREGSPSLLEDLENED